MKIPKFMIKVCGEIYANELYNVNGEHIFDFNEAKDMAALLYPNGDYAVYNGIDSFDTSDGE